MNTAWADPEMGKADVWRYYVSLEIVVRTPRVQLLLEGGLYGPL